MQGKVLPGQSAGMRVYVGIDVCKERLDVYLHPIGQTLSVDNSKQGIKRLKKELAGFDIALVTVEATSKYHCDVHRALSECGISVAVVNPLRPRLFAEAIGELAKTDAIDARILAMFGAMTELDATPVMSVELEELKEIVRTRQQAVEDQTAVKNRLGACKLKFLKRELERQLVSMEKGIVRLEGEIQRRIKADIQLRRRFKILCSIPGIGHMTAAVLITGMSELGACSGKAAALLAGLAPIARDSGEKEGKRHIKGGRRFVRQALYMASLTAARWNPALKAFYNHLIAKYPKKYALTAVMRKLVVLANTLIKEDRLWEPQRPLPNH